MRPPPRPRKRQRTEPILLLLYELRYCIVIAPSAAVERVDGGVERQRRERGYVCGCLWVGVGLLMSVHMRVVRVIRVVWVGVIVIGVGVGDGSWTAGDAE